MLPGEVWCRAFSKVHRIGPLKAGDEYSEVSIDQEPNPAEFPFEVRVHLGVKQSGLRQTYSQKFKNLQQAEKDFEAKCHEVQKTYPAEVFIG